MSTRAKLFFTAVGMYFFFHFMQFVDRRIEELQLIEVVQAEYR